MENYITFINVKIKRIRYKKSQQKVLPIQIW